MAQRPLPRLTIAVGMIVAMLTVPLATPPAMAAVDLVGDDDTDEEESEGSDSAEPEQGDAPQNEAGSSSSDGNLGQALGDVVNSVTGGSDEQQAAADGEQPQEVAPEPQAEPEPAQSQPQGGGGSGGGGGDTAAQSQGSGQQAGSGEAPAASQPPAPSGPRQATRPAVNANGQPPPQVDSPSFDSSIDSGGHQPQAPEVFSEPSTERNQDVAALPSIPLLDESADSGAAVVPNHLVAAAAALAVVLAAAHSLNATRRFASGRLRRHDEETEAGPFTREG